MKIGFSILLLALCAAVAGRAQTNDARLTPAERVAWTHLNQRAAAAQPSHVLWFNDGRGLVGWLLGETNGMVRWAAPFGADGRWLMDFERAELSHAEALRLKPSPINYCDVSFQLEFPELRLIRAPPYTLLTDDSPQAAERYLGVLQVLQTNFVARFGALTEGLGLPDHVQVLIFTAEDAYRAYQRRMLGRRPNVMGFYRPAQQRLAVFDQRYTAGMDEILARLAWQSEKQQVRAATDAAANHVRLVLLGEACGMLRHAEASNHRVLRHEGAHQLFHASGILAEGATPGWLAEGLALWCESRQPGALNYGYSALVKTAQEEGRLIPLAELLGHRERSDRGFYGGEREAELAYAEAWSVVRLLLRPALQEKFFAYLKHLRRLEATADIRRTPPVALLCRFLGLTPAELDARWKQSIARLPFDPE
jgi:hypothetical protein